MTDQPDHRTEAEKWLTTASDPTNRLRSGRSVEKPYAERQVEALIAIGHALLAFTDDGGYEGLPPGDAEPIDAPNYVGSRDQLRDALRRMHPMTVAPSPHPPTEG
jgi:hypothetical protein